MAAPAYTFVAVLKGTAEQGPKVNHGALTWGFRNFYSCLCTLYTVLLPGYQRCRNLLSWWSWARSSFWNIVWLKEIAISRSFAIREYIFQWLTINKSVSYYLANLLFNITISHHIHFGMMNSHRCHISFPMTRNFHWKTHSHWRNISRFCLVCRKNPLVSHCILEICVQS